MKKLKRIYPLMPEEENQMKEEIRNEYLLSRYGEKGKDFIESGCPCCIGSHIAIKKYRPFVFS
ncbi:MAG TPA: hypothetical protein VJB11_02455 [archaeon]|nr:hypothetical protein [archaeon]